MKQVATHLLPRPSSNLSWTLERTQVVRGRVKRPSQCPRRDRLQPEPTQRWPGHPHLLLRAGREGIEVVIPTPGGQPHGGGREDTDRSSGWRVTIPDNRDPAPAGQLCPGTSAHILELPTRTHSYVLSLDLLFLSIFGYQAKSEFKESIPAGVFPKWIPTS